MGVWLDPRASEQVERNDYAALAIVARDSHGYVYVLSIDIRREGTLAQLERLWAVFDLLGPSALYGYEQNGFQILMGVEFKRLQRERQRAHRPSNCILRGFTSTRNKADRIASLAPRIDNGWIEFATSISQTVIEQWRDHPSSSLMMAQTPQSAPSG